MTSDGSDTAARTRLSSDQLRVKIDASTLGFRTTAELEPLGGLIGQERALKAIEFGTSIDQDGFNLFVLGPSAAGKTSAVRAFLETRAKSEAVPPSRVYVNNFDDPNVPRTFALAAPLCQQLADGMVGVIDELRGAIPAMFESDDYEQQRRAIEERFREAQEGELDALNKRVEAEDLSIVRTPDGLTMVPVEGGEVVTPEAFRALPEDERKVIEEKIDAFQGELRELVERVPKHKKEGRQAVQALNKVQAERNVDSALGDIRAAFGDHGEVTGYLDAARADLVRNIALFMPKQEEEGQLVYESVETVRDDRFRRYMVNVLVSHERAGRPRLEGAPIVEELNPTAGNLVGRVEHIPRMGTFATDFLLIKPGALHRANGGYLLLDASKLLSSPLAWEALKRALKRGKIYLEMPGEDVSLVTTQTLDPEPVPLDVKVILFGDRHLYYTLSGVDPEFDGLFKVQADFDETIERSAQHVSEYARLVASIVEKRGLKPVAAAGVARLIEEGVRLAGDSLKLSLEIGKLADIVREADYWASENGSEVIGANDVSRAIDERRHRADLMYERTRESIIRDTMMIDTQGAETGQINGLSVLSLGNLAFGKPTRITASVRMGEGRVTDIEREVTLGGPLHSKGVMILWGYLAGHLAREAPFSLAANLVFEQSYSGVDGDSASSTELYALLSALSGVAIRQSIAVTGSVNQKGEVQAIGGVNEKIEGFFDICAERGLTGEQGVMIPKANVVSLMLRDDVVAAADAGQFSIHGVATISEGIEILTGVQAGERGPGGTFDADTIFGRSERTLLNYAEARRAFLNGGRSEATANV